DRRLASVRTAYLLRGARENRLKLKAEGFSGDTANGKCWVTRGSRCSLRLRRRSRTVVGWHRGQRASLWATEQERRSIHFRRSRSAFEDPNHLEPMAATGNRMRIRLDTINKVPTGQI